MAFTERYVTSGAGGGGSGTSGSPWTFAEAITNAVAGDRINVQSDAAYSIGATTFGAGTFAAPILWRGYDATIGDCDDLGRNADGTLIGPTETCSVCHGPGRSSDVKVKHKVAEFRFN